MASFTQYALRQHEAIALLTPSIVHRDGYFIRADLAHQILVELAAVAGMNSRAVGVGYAA
jgi:hypothetical protein